MLLILKKYFQTDYSEVFSDMTVHDFVRGQSVATGASSELSGSD